MIDNILLLTDNTCNNYIIIGIIIFFFLCALVYSKNNDINQLKEEIFNLKDSKKRTDNHSENLRIDLLEKEKECEELKDQIEKLWFINKPSKKNKKTIKGIPPALEKGMTVTVLEDGIYKDLVYTGKRAVYNVWKGYLEDNNGSYVFFTPESKDIIRGVKEAELNDFMSKIKSYQI